MFTAMVVKHGTQPSTLVFALLAQSGTDTHAMIHAAEEESSIPPAVNVSAQQVTGTEDHVSSVPILKSGQLPSWFAFVLMETGTEKLVSSVQPTKSGIQPQ